MFLHVRATICHLALMKILEGPVSKRDCYTIMQNGVDWMHLAQDKKQWWVLVQTITKLWVP
jgi:hypothetical protein